MVSSGTSQRASIMALTIPVLFLPRLHTIRAGTLSSEHSRVNAEDKQVFTAELSKNQTLEKKRIPLSIVVDTLNK